MTQCRHKMPLIMSRREAGVRTTLPPGIIKSAHLDGKVGVAPVPSADDQLKSLVDTGKAVTVWEVAGKLANGDPKQVSAILDGLTTKGIFAKFRAGFNNYYASPRLALTVEAPTLRTIILDSVKNLFLRLRYKRSVEPKDNMGHGDTDHPLLWYESPRISIDIHDSRAL